MDKISVDDFARRLNEAVEKTATLSEEQARAFLAEILYHDPAMASCITLTDKQTLLEEVDNVASPDVE